MGAHYETFRHTVPSESLHFTTTILELTDQKVKVAPTKTEEKDYKIFHQANVETREEPQD